MYSNTHLSIRETLPLNTGLCTLYTPQNFSSHHNIYLYVVRYIYLTSTVQSVSLVFKQHSVKCLAQGIQLPRNDFSYIYFFVLKVHFYVSPESTPSYKCTAHVHYKGREYSAQYIWPYRCEDCTKSVNDTTLSIYKVFPTAMSPRWRVEEASGWVATCKTCLIPSLVPIYI